MNRCPLIFLFIVLVFSGCKQEQVKQPVLIVSFAGHDPGPNVMLYRLMQGAEPFDTAVINSRGEFEFFRVIPESGFFQLRLSNGEHLTMVLHPKKTTHVSANPNRLKRSAVVTGNSETSSILMAEEITRLFEEDIRQLTYVFTDSTRPRPGIVLVDSMVRMTDTLFKPRKKAMLRLANNNLTNLGILPIVLQRAGNHTFFDPDSDRLLLVKADTFLVRHFSYLPLVQQFHYQLDSVFSLIDSTAQVLPGNLMPEPGVLSTWKQPIPLARFKGHPMLVVFWSATDSVGRTMVPDIKAMAGRFKQEGLELYMISMDSVQSDWELGIAEHRLACWHVSDLKGMQSPLIRQYGIRSFPTLFLLDKDGTIVAKNIWGETLADSIAAVIKK
jgi:peroxiredoxin